MSNLNINMMMSYSNLVDVVLMNENYTQDIFINGENKLLPQYSSREDFLQS